MAIWSFAFGLLVVSVLPFLIPLHFLLLISACVLLLLIRYGLGISRYGLYFVLGLALNTWQLQNLTQAQLAPQFDNTWQTLSFKIVSIPQQRPLAQVFIAQVLDLQCPQSDCPAIRNKRIRLSWYRSQHSLEAGQVWSAKTKLKRPRGLANPGGFDYQAWLLSQNLVATGYVHSEAQLKDKQFSLASLRKSLADRILTAAGDSHYKRFWVALLVADRSALTTSDWQTLQATGTVHLMAISGLHIGLVSLWAFWFGRMFARCGALLWARSAAYLAHWLPPLLSCAMALFYAALAGFSIPTLRAFTACVVINLCWLYGLNLAPLVLLGFGAAVVALGDPMAWQSNGFWLSFSAVFLLIYVLSGRLERQPLRTAIWLQIVLSLGLSVPLLAVGQGISWVSPLANLIAVPVVSFFIVPGLFIASLLSAFSATFAHAVLLGLDWIFNGLWVYLQWLQALPQTLFWFPKPLSWMALSIAFVGFLLFLAPRGLHVRGLGALALGVGVTLQPQVRPNLRMTVMDVGQGLSVVVQTPADTWVYDTGPAFSDSFDAGSRIVAPYLRAQGVKEISLMVSHGDNDHSGGAQSLLSLFEVNSLMVGEYLSLVKSPSVAGNGTKVVPDQRLCGQGQKWQLNTIEMTVLWPSLPGSQEGNNASCVVLLQVPLNKGVASKTLSILMVGDIDRRTEKRLLSLLPQNVDVVIAAHHGSKSSSSPEFVHKVNPRIVVFSAGYNSRYNHPNPQVVSRFQAQGAVTYNTATSGAVVFEWHEGSETVVETRVAEPKPWY